MRIFFDDSYFSSERLCVDVLCPCMDTFAESVSAFVSVPVSVPVVVNNDLLLHEHYVLPSWFRSS